MLLDTQSRSQHWNFPLRNASSCNALFTKIYWFQLVLSARFQCGSQLSPTNGASATAVFVNDLCVLMKTVINQLFLSLRNVQKSCRQLSGFNNSARTLFNFFHQQTQNYETHSEIIVNAFNVSSFSYHV